MLLAPRTAPLIFCFVRWLCRSPNNWNKQSSVAGMLRHGVRTAIPVAVEAAVRPRHSRHLSSCLRAPRRLRRVLWRWVMQRCPGSVAGARGSGKRVVAASGRSRPPLVWMTTVFPRVVKLRPLPRASWSGTQRNPLWSPPISQTCNERIPMTPLSISLPRSRLIAT